MPSIPSDHWLYTIDEWSREPLNKIIKALPKLSVVFDIGANAGGFTELIHGLNKDAQFHCFEPVERNFIELQKNVPYATCHKFGIYYGEKSSRMMWRGENCGAYFLEQVDSGEPRYDANEVIELKTLEEFGLPQPDLIKIDIEGAEENVLTWSYTVRNCPTLIIEWHPDHINPIDFFEKHLPKHKIKINIENKQFLLCRK